MKMPHDPLAPRLDYRREVPERARYFDNFLAGAIVASILFAPLGLVSLTLAILAARADRKGQFDDARRLALWAKVIGVVALVFVPAGLLIVVVFGL
jgi:hypothetical protein